MMWGVGRESKEGQLRMAERQMMALVSGVVVVVYALCRGCRWSAVLYM